MGRRARNDTYIDGRGRFDHDINAFRPGLDAMTMHYICLFNQF